jgi:hypothetical protein
MRPLHTMASTHVQSRPVGLCAFCNPLRHYRRLALALPLCVTHASPFLSPFPRRGFAPRSLQRVTMQRYYGDSDSCTAHRSPHLSRHTFLSFRFQPRELPGHRLPPRQRNQRVSDFAMHEKARRNSPPNRVRHPTNQQFALGCSPPALQRRSYPRLRSCSFLRHGFSPC